MIANDAAGKIQKNWKRFFLKQNLLKGLLLNKIMDVQYQITKRGFEKLAKFSEIMETYQKKIDKVNNDVSLFIDIESIDYSTMCKIFFSKKKDKNSLETKIGEIP